MLTRLNGLSTFITSHRLVLRVMYYIMLSNRTLTCFLTISDGVVFPNFVGSSSEFNRFEASQKFSPYYVIKNFITHLQNPLPPLPFMSQINSDHAASKFLKMHFMLSFHLRLGLPSSIFPSGLPTKTLYAPALSPMRATCHAQLIFSI